MAIHARTFPVLQPQLGAKNSVTPPRGATLVSAQPTIGPYYFFEAKVKVDRDVWDAFQAQRNPESAIEIVRLLEDVGGFTLRHAGTFVDDEYYHFYNFWELGPNANALAQAELKLADNALWAQFSKVVQREEDKQIIFPLTATARTELPADLDVTKLNYLRIEYDLEHFALAEVQARLEAELVDTGTQLGWYFGFSYLHLTGLEGQVVQIWLVPATLRPADADKQVGQLSWLRKLPDGTSLFKGDPDVTLLRRSTFDHDPRSAAHMLDDVLAKLQKPSAGAIPTNTTRAPVPAPNAATDAVTAAMNAAAAAMNAAAAAMNAATKALGVTTNGSTPHVAPFNGATSHTSAL